MPPTEPAGFAPRSGSRWTGTAVACSGLDAPGAEPDVGSSAPATTSVGVPMRAMMRRTAAGESTTALARRRSISSRNSATSRIRAADGNCRCCATSPTRLRYS